MCSRSGEQLASLTEQLSEKFPVSYGYIGSGREFCHGQLSASEEVHERVSVQVKDFACASTKFYINTAFGYVFLNLCPLPVHEHEDTTS